MVGSRQLAGAAAGTGRPETDDRGRLGAERTTADAVGRTTASRTNGRDAGTGPDTLVCGAGPGRRRAKADRRRGRPGASDTDTHPPRGARKGREAWTGDAAAQDGAVFGRLRTAGPGRSGRRRGTDGGRETAKRSSDQGAGRRKADVTGGRNGPKGDAGRRHPRMEPKGGAGGDREHEPHGREWLKQVTGFGEDQTVKVAENGEGGRRGSGNPRRGDTDANRIIRIADGTSGKRIPRIGRVEGAGNPQGGRTSNGSGRR
jgi:hypothetical protein